MSRFLWALLVFARPALADDAWPGTGNEVALSPHDVLTAYAENFDPQPPSGLSLKPSCLKSNGLDLIVLDAGHNDSPEAQRSHAKRCPTCPYENGRPLIHEGRLNQAVAWMTYDMMMKAPGLSAAEREELRAMVRFSRLPGETQFGQYERDTGYFDRTNGVITSNTDNRVEHINLMMANHRPARNAGRTNVTSRTLIQIIHANSSDLYDAADYLFLMRPESFTTRALEYMRELARSFQTEMTGYFDAALTDAAAVRDLKNAVRGSYNPSRTLIQHYSGSRMLKPGLGNGQTIRVISEGFFMDGKVGNLVQRELSRPGFDRSLRFEREGEVVARYPVSDAYIRYAKSLVRGFSDYFGCETVTARQGPVKALAR